ncbi:Asp-tRNA(Asn)/Glu-tRNA(Gln) amidotransferase subunit GatA [Cytophagaceae bacterium ABcell3]|nr:Asp-tRNA(Asn)/Glu-tRNA(Gln) amidotransferase subunit GatA [Cytophagaceae bacterium ABcell3]
MKSYRTLREIREDIDTGKLSCRQLTQYYLDNIKANQDLNAFLEVYEEEALAKADEVDAKIKAGTAGKLAGMVIGLKDVLCHKDHKLQAASKILDGFVSQFNGTAVQRIIDEDAIIIGRQNCDEFAMGSSTENSSFGPTLNAADKNRVPGGSSGGSAVAVQAEMCFVSLGSDTGGSVRQPAAFCGVVGLKPTYSRISRYGLIAYASSFDCIGVFSKSIEDSALVLETIAGPDDYDSTVSFREVPKYSQKLALDRKVKVGYLKASVESEGVSPEIREKTSKTLEQLKKDGHTVEAVDFPLLDYFLPAYYILTTAEASSNLSRFDGVKYGYRSPDATNLETMYKKSRSEGFGNEVKRRIMLGTFVLSAGFYDAYYTKAQKVRRLIQEETEKILKEYDFLVIPASPTTAFKLGENTEDPLAMYLADVFTVQANLTGIPGVSFPVGNDSNGLPIGLQVLTKWFGEQELLAFSKYLSDKQKL